MLPVSGVLSIAIAAVKSDKGLIVPRENGREALLAAPKEIIAVTNLYEIVEILNGVREKEPYLPEPIQAQPESHEVGFEDIRGQSVAKRALAIAAAGMHNLLTLCIF